MNGVRHGGTVLACFAAVVLGGFVSLYTAGVALFSDGDFSERPPVLVASIVAFLILGLALGFIAPRVWKPVAICLGVSAIPFVVLFGLDAVGNTPMMALASGFILGDAAAGALGALAGARLRARRSL